LFAQTLPFDRERKYGFATSSALESIYRVGLDLTAFLLSAFGVTKSERIQSLMEKAYLRLSEGIRSHVYTTGNSVDRSL
jgi:ribosomal protein S13